MFAYALCCSSRCAFDPGAAAVIVFVEAFCSTVGWVASVSRPLEEEASAAAAAAPSEQETHSPGEWRCAPPGILAEDARLQSCGRRLPEMVEGRLRPASAVARCCHRFYSRCDRPVAKRFAAAAPQFLLLPPTKRGERSRLVCSCWRSNAKDASRAPFTGACTCFYLRPEVYTSSACNRSRGGSARIWPGPAPVRATFRLCAIIPGERWPRRPRRARQRAKGLVPAVRFTAVAAHRSDRW